MRSFTSTEYSRMRNTQISVMNDTITITNRTIYTDDYGDVAYSGIVTSGVACGFEFVSKGDKKYDKGEITIVEYDAQVRLPLSQSVGINDTMTLETLAGVSYDDVFDVYEYPRKGPTAILVNLKRKSN